MIKHSADELTQSLSDIESKLPPLEAIKNAFWKTTTQCKILLTQAGATTKPLKVTSAARRFTPNGLFYLDSLHFHGENPAKVTANLTVVIKPVGAPAYDLKLHSTGTPPFTFGYVRTFCEWFEIYSSSIVGKPLLNKISIFGSDSDQLSKYAKNISDILDTKDRIESFKAQAKAEYTETTTATEKLKTENLDLINTITTYTTTLTDLQANLEVLRTQVKDEEDALSKLKLAANHTEEKLTASSNNVTQLAQTAESLNQKISSLKGELEKLTNDKNLISDEYGPYVREGRSQAGIYVFLSTIPLAIIIFSVYQLYAGASKLLLAEYSSATDIAGAFLLRIPFAAVFGLAIFYSWRLASSTINKIFTIHSDRLVLAKLLVLAREAIHSSAKGLTLSSEAIFQEQIKLKVEVLKGHLSRDLGKNFEYNPKTPPLRTSLSEVAKAVNDDPIIKDDTVTNL